jgi:hypothetical protein
MYTKNTADIKGSVVKFDNLAELDDFVKKLPNDQHIVVDQDCLRLHCYFRVFNSNTQRATVQIKEENENMFDVKPSIEGGILLIDKAQMDLFETRHANV